MTAEVPIERLHAPIAAYYGEKVRRFGATNRVQEGQPRSRECSVE